MAPYRNTVEARRKKERPVQKVADENCYMSSADFNEKYSNANQSRLRERSGKRPPSKASDRDGGQ
jgi:hypothetical protein